MEVFTLDTEGQPAAAIVDAVSGRPRGDRPPIGDGAVKCQDPVRSARLAFSSLPHRSRPLPEAVRLRDGRTERGGLRTVYLKDFVPGRPKDPLGLRNPSA